MVKILKAQAQDGKYVRTMRSPNVMGFCVRCGSRNLLPDRVKSQLSTMADLVRESGGTWRVGEGEPARNPTQTVKRMSSRLARRGSVLGNLGS